MNIPSQAEGNAHSQEVGYDQGRQLRRFAHLGWPGRGLITNAGVPNLRPRDNSLDSLRAFAAMAVLVQHTTLGTLGGTSQVTKKATQLLGPLSGLAVNVFFVLSGLLLAASVRRSLGVRSFLRQRVARLLPLYTVVGLVLTAAAWPWSPDDTTRIWQYFTLLSVYSGHYLLGPAWTLCVEAVFTVAIALLAPYVRTFPPRRAAALYAVTGLALTATGLVLKVVTKTYTYPSAYEPLAASLAFFAGCVGHEMQLRARLSTVRFRPILLGIGLASWIVSIPLSLLSASDIGLSGASYAFVTASSLLVISTVKLQTAWVAWLGVRSYGLYLWHLPLLAFLQHIGLLGVGGLSAAAVALCLTAIISVALAALTFVTVERPGLRIGAPCRR